MSDAPVPDSDPGVVTDVPPVEHVEHDDDADQDVAEHGTEEEHDGDEESDVT